MDETISTIAESNGHIPGDSHKRDILGTLVGLLVFFCGVGLLLLTFSLAYSLFEVPPDKAIGLTPHQPIDVSTAGNSAGILLLKIFLLLIMALVGSMIANRGISLYTGARPHHK
jgi:hypothetical protein